MTPTVRRLYLHCTVTILWYMAACMACTLLCLINDTHFHIWKVDNVIVMCSLTLVLFILHLLVPKPDGTLSRNQTMPCIKTWSTNGTLKRQVKLKTITLPISKSGVSGEMTIRCVRVSRKNDGQRPGAAQAHASGGRAVCILTRLGIFSYLGIGYSLLLIQLKREPISNIFIWIEYLLVFM